MFSVSHLNTLRKAEIDRIIFFSSGKQAFLKLEPALESSHSNSNDGDLMLLQSK